MNRSLLVSFVLLRVILTSGLVTGQSQNSIYDAILIETNLSTTNISTDELRQILAEKSAIVFDVRTFQEYSIDHIPGAVNISGKPGTTREAFTSDVNEIGRVVKGNKTASIVTYCNGPYCNKSKRVANELIAAGYQNVRRYQLAIPVWRALGEVTETELEGVQYIYSKDQTVVFIDARNIEQFNAGTLLKARNIPADNVEGSNEGPEVKRAKKDGRLPMEDHNTRVIVFGLDSGQARHVAKALAKNAFHNVSYYPDTFEQLKAAIK